MDFKIQNQKNLKVFHLFFAACWVGAALILNLGNYFLNSEDAGLSLGVTTTLKFVDDWVIIPAALGTLFTGLLYSLTTPWGWFKHHWITVKWIITVAGILFGTFFLGPWLNSLPELLRAKGGEAFQDTLYLHNKKMLEIFGLIQFASLLFAFVISTLKPWGKPLKTSKKTAT